MATAGRKPLGAGHVDQLSGSERAKLRLATILNTLRGELKVADACQQLGVCQSRFFAMRHHWLQEALELLEPRPAGRPRSQVDPRQLREPAHDRCVEDDAVCDSVGVEQLEQPREVGAR